MENKQGKLVKIYDKKIANALQDGGFSYMTELQNNREVYVFIQSAELMKLLGSTYTTTELTVDTKLRF